MAGFDGAMTTPINSNSAAAIRNTLNVPSTTEMEEAIAQWTASTTQTLTVFDDRVTPSAIDIPRARKTGKIVSIGGVFTVKVALASNQTSVFVLPNDCIPQFNMYFAVIRESDGKAFIGQVSSSGNFNVLHGGGLSVGDVIYFGFTYAL